MSVVSGLNAKVSQDGTTAVKTVGAWRFNPTNPLSSAVASNSGGGTFNLPATADSQSSYDFYDKEPPAIPGTTYTHLYQTETHEYSVPVMCESVSASCDIAGGNLIRGSASFGGNGAWTAQVVTSVTNSVTPTAFSSVGCKATWQPIVAGTLGTAASLPDVQGWEWAAARANVAYASDLTAGHMKRTKGALSATASVTLLQGCHELRDDERLCDDVRADQRADARGRHRGGLAARAHDRVRLDGVRVHLDDVHAGHAADAGGCGVVRVTSDGVTHIREDAGRPAPQSRPSPVLEAR